MSRPDAERALSIYKTFAKQTDQVVQYLSLARQYEMSTRLEVPRLKHAPTTLTSALEEYLNDADFEINRRQYLAQQQAKKGGKPISSAATASTPFAKSAKPDSSFPSTSAMATSNVTTSQPKGPAPDLIDFFESIEQNQQAMANPQVVPYGAGQGSAPQFQPGQFAPQQTGYNPFLQQQFPPQQQQPHQLQPDFTGAGFGGYTPQTQLQQQPTMQGYGFSTQLSSIPQNGVAEFPQQTQIQPSPPPLQAQQTSTNPFRQSMMPTGPSGNAQLSRQSTNPFAKSSNGEANSQVNSGSQFGQAVSQSQQQELQNQSAFFQSPTTSQSPPASFPPAGLVPQRTGTNPFAKNRPQASTAPLVANVTGSTNPFRQSAFVNQETGQGWQHSTQGTFSGFNVNHVDTVPVFPRPGAN